MTTKHFLRFVLGSKL